MSTSLAILTGFTVGFLGSFHCLGMCGPLALALPMNHLAGVRKILAILFYNLGRAFMYGILGVFFGFISSRFALYGLQQILSITAGSLILLALLFNYTPFASISIFKGITQKVKYSMMRLLKISDNNLFLFLFIGLLNGLLPCGLVYVAVASSLAASTVLNGFLLMFSFGLGTFPMMMGIYFFAKGISTELRFQIRRLVPFFVGIMAVLLILRGLNLGIPYISPHIADNAETASSCH